MQQTADIVRHALPETFTGLAARRTCVAVKSSLLGALLALAASTAQASIPVTPNQTADPRVADASALQRQQERQQEPKPSQATQPKPFTREMLTSASDADLTALAAGWGQLQPRQRRMLLAEMRNRMLRAGTRKSAPRKTLVPRVQITGQVGGSAIGARQYGHSVSGRITGGVIKEVRKTRRADGTVVVETRVLRLTPKTPASAEGEGTAGLSAQDRATQPQMPGVVTKGAGSVGADIPAGTARPEAPVIEASTQSERVKRKTRRRAFGTGFGRRDDKTNP